MAVTCLQHLKQSQNVVDFSVSLLIFIVFINMNTCNTTTVLLSCLKYIDQKLHFNIPYVPMCWCVIYGFCVILILKKKCFLSFSSMMMDLWWLFLPRQVVIYSWWGVFGLCYWQASFNPGQCIWLACVCLCVRMKYWHAIRQVLCVSMWVKKWKRIERKIQMRRLDGEKWTWMEVKLYTVIVWVQNRSKK